MRKFVRLGGAFAVALMLTVIVASSAFAAGPYASAITSSTSGVVADITDSIGDVLPLILQIAAALIVVRVIVKLVRRAA